MCNTSSVQTQGLCPTGWHIPTDTEWMALEISMGMSSGTALQSGARGSKEGAKLKTTIAWAYGAGNDSSGFSALPAGSRSNGNWNNLNLSANFWSATEYQATSTWMRELVYNNQLVSRYLGGKGNAYSVRCLKDTP